MRSWGPFTRYIEIGNDLYPTRHVDAYENGYILRYDRIHWVDDYGLLAGMKHSNKWDKWWGPSLETDVTEFEEIWEAAAASRAWPKQMDTAKMSQIGAVPFWLSSKRS
jgi:hypothetical protein